MKKCLQSIPEPQAPIENNVSANEISTTESTDDAPKSPPPAVPVEVSVSPAPAPVITEDVASVTKVIILTPGVRLYFALTTY